MFKLSFSTNAFRRFTVFEAISSISKAGYSGIEIMADAPHAWPGSLTLKESRSIRTAVEKAGLEIANINAFTMHKAGDTWNPSWITADGDERKRRIDHTLRAIDFSAELGCRSISTEPGGPPNGLDREAALAMFKAGLLQVADRASRKKIKVLIEPEPGLLIEKSSEMADFLNGLDREIFGVNFDVGHFFCAGEDPVTLIENRELPFDHIHLEDIAATREHFHLQLGKGSVPIRKVVAALKDQKYEGFVTVELYPYQDQPVVAAAEAFNYLKEEESCLR